MALTSSETTQTGFQAWLAEHALRPQAYYLMVGRFVPENNFETVIREFLHAETERNLLIISTMNRELMHSLREKYRFQKDPRIRFAGTVYDRELLRLIRRNAFAYIHGHEVGGTNPSLLEAMGCTGLNLLLDVVYNREVAEDAALYWTKERGSLSALIRRAEAMPTEDRERLGRMARERIRTHYSWQDIADSYEALFLGSMEACKPAP